MPIKALNDRKKLSSDFNEANDAFIDAVLGALQGGEIPLDLARAYLAHPVAMMHSDDPQAVANYFERILSQQPKIDWTPGERAGAAMTIPDRELEFSPLSGRVTRDGVTVQVHIYRFAGTDEGWTLEVVDHEDGSTVWKGAFDTDVEAYDAFERCIRGMASGRSRRLRRRGIDGVWACARPEN